MLIGVITFLLGCFVSWKYQVIYDGVLDAHSYLNITYSKAFITNCINVIVMCLSLFVVGKSIHPKIKMIDILNTSFIYRTPIYVYSAVSNLPSAKLVTDKVMTAISGNALRILTASDWWKTLAFGCLYGFLFIYSLILLFNGFKKAAQPQKKRQYLLVVVAIIVAEIISKLILNQL